MDFKLPDTDTRRAADALERIADAIEIQNCFAVMGMGMVQENIMGLAFRERTAQAVLEAAGRLHQKLDERRNMQKAANK